MNEINWTGEGSVFFFHILSKHFTFFTPLAYILFISCNDWKQIYKIFLLIRLTLISVRNNLVSAKILIF